MFLPDLSREQFLSKVDVPREAVAHGRGTDIEEDLPLLYAVISILKPETIVELGTRHGISTKTMAAAARNYGGKVVAIDPEDCSSYLNGIKNCEFIQLTGEDALKQYGPLFQRLPFIMIDTDPHTYSQTYHWLQTWVQNLAPNGCAAFHDIEPARPEIRVGDAVRDWVMGRPGWTWREYRPKNNGPVFNGGIGLLWRLTKNNLT